MKTSAFKEKLYRARPKGELTVETPRTRKRTRVEPCDATSVERGVRQLLSDKVFGNLVGLWLLIPEHLRLGTWDLLCGWTGQPPSRPEPRFALQMVHEAALCATGLRERKVLSQRGFELANGLPLTSPSKWRRLRVCRGSGSDSKCSTIDFNDTVPWVIGLILLQQSLLAVPSVKAEQGTAEGYALRKLAHLA